MPVQITEERLLIMARRETSYTEFKPKWKMSRNSCGERYTEKDHNDKRAGVMTYKGKGGCWDTYCKLPPETATDSVTETRRAKKKGHREGERSSQMQTVCLKGIGEGKKVGWSRGIYYRLQRFGTGGYG